MSEARRSLLPRGLPFGWPVVGIAFAAILGLSLFLDPALLGHVPSVCPMRGLTGVPCPGCGLTRSFVATAHLDLGAAFAAHPFGPVLFLFCVAVLVALGLRALTGRWPVRPESVERLRPAAWAFLGVWLAWAAVRAALSVL